LEPGDHTLHLNVGGTERRYLLHVPPGTDGTTPLPVVLMFHGAGGTAEIAKTETGWADKADRAGFLAVFPEGTPIDPSRLPAFRSNPQIWNDGSWGNTFGPLPVEDVGFVSALLDDLPAHVAVEPKRIFATGFSNGAGLTFRLGAELSRRIAAIAPVAGYCRGKDLTVERPVSLIYLIGTSDPLVPLEGGPGRSPWTGKLERRPPVRDSILRWAAAIGCPLQPRTVEYSPGVKLKVYGPGRDGAEVHFYTIAGLGHFWPGAKANLPEALAGKPSKQVQATEVIWDFFTKHPMR
jgi:polyhydroxybutyrate depolymerase